MSNSRKEQQKQAVEKYAGKILLHYSLIELTNLFYQTQEQAKKRDAMQGRDPVKIALKQCSYTDPDIILADTVIKRLQERCGNGGQNFWQIVECLKFLRGRVCGLLNGISIGNTLKK